MEKIDMKAVGARIRTIRLDRGLTLRDFSQRFGTNEKIVSRWENGVITKKTDCLKKISEFANISIHELLHGVKRYMYVITRSNYSGPIVKTDTFARVYTSLEAAKRDVVRYEQVVPVYQDYRFSIEKMEVVE